MQRCLDLALLGKGFVAPNPMVGCVIVCDDKIIGEGYHQHYGQAHAEVHAIHLVKDKQLLKRSTLYVNLEPCSHWGKTPPCANLIIEHHIPKVVIGTIDSHSKVAGKGVHRMQQAGIEVTVGVLDEACKLLNKRFFSFHERHRPYIILKWAQTKDGFIDIAPHLKSTVKGLWITNDLCRKLVHKWRAEEMAIMVGTHTALTDNPSLTTRDWAGKSPIRISIDKQLVFSKQLHLLDDTVPTIIFTNKKAEDSINTHYISLSEITADTMIAELFQQNIQSVIIEGGTKLLQSFIDQNLWDEARVFTGDKQFVEGVKAPLFEAVPARSELLEETRLDWYFNTSSRLIINK